MYTCIVSYEFSLVYEFSFDLGMDANPCKISTQQEQKQKH